MTAQELNKQIGSMMDRYFDAEDPRTVKALAMDISRARNQLAAMYEKAGERFAAAEERDAASGFRNAALL